MSLKGKNIGIFAENQYEDLELWYPKLRFKEAGANVEIIGSGSNDIFKSKHGYPVKVSMNAADVNIDDFDAIIIPGGYSPDIMRTYKSMVDLVRAAYTKNKIVAAICHAGWMLASADIVKDKQITCYHSIKDDLINAGAHYLDQEVVKDGNIITSRRPSDLPAFCRTIIETLKG